MNFGLMSILENSFKEMQILLPKMKKKAISRLFAIFETETPTCKPTVTPFKLYLRFFYIFNQTSTFNEHILDLPENTIISNFTVEGNRYTANSYIVSYPNESILVEITTESGAVKSPVKYLHNWIKNNCTSLSRKCGNWTRINLIAELFFKRRIVFKFIGFDIDEK